MKYLTFIASVMFILATGASADVAMNNIIFQPGAGSGSGTGSGFPLAEDGDLAGYTLYNGTFYGTHTGDGSGLTGVASGNAFPLTNDASAAWYDIDNIGYLRGSNISFRTLSLSGNSSVSGTGYFGNNLTIDGNLTVNGDTYENTIIHWSTNVSVGTTTTYVHSVVYSTNIVYQKTVTELIDHTTNYVDTYVNVGGNWDTSLADWTKIPSFESYLNSGSPSLHATGAWDFADATVTGIDSGSTITNIGDTLTGNGDTTALNVSSALTNQVAQGETAYGWGDHSTFGYLTNGATITTGVYAPAPTATNMLANKAYVDSAIIGGAATNASLLTQSGTNYAGSIELGTGLSVGTNTMTLNVELTSATGVEMDAPTANWLISHTNGALQNWRLGNQVTNIYAAGATNSIEAFTVRVYPETYSFSAGSATWGGAEPTVTNGYMLIDVLIDHTNTILYLLREEDE